MNNPLSIPKPIADRLTELYQLVEDNPFEIAVNDLSDFLHMHPDSLRASIISGQCPFGLGWQKNQNGNRGFKIPTAPFFMWYTQSAGFRV